MWHLSAQFPGMGDAMEVEPLPSLQSDYWSPCVPVRLTFLSFPQSVGWQYPVPPLVQRLTLDSQETSSTLASACWCGFTLFLGMFSQLHRAMQFPKDQCERRMQSAPACGTPPTKKWAPVSCTQIAPSFLKATLEHSFGTGRVKNPGKEGITC